LDDSGFDVTKELCVDMLTVVAGRKIVDSVDFVVGNVQLAQPHIIVAFVVVPPDDRLVCRNAELLVAKEDGDDDACQTKQSSENEEHDLERWV